MLSLILAIGCSASIAILFKWASIKQLDSKRVTISNYLTATLISGVMILCGDATKQFVVGSEDFNKSLSIGIATGIFFLLSFTTYQMSVKRNGASLSGMFAKLGILIPMAISIFYWRELPTFLQSIGIAIAVVAIAIANFKGDNSSESKHNFSILMVLFVVGGIAEFLNKVFQKVTSLDYKALFLFFVFLTALILSLIPMFKQYKRVEKPGISWFLGLMVGIPNLFSSFFLIDALDTYPASVVFPSYSAGSILLITLISVLLFREKLYKKDWVAILLTSLSLILLNG